MNAGLKFRKGRRHLMAATRDCAIDFLCGCGLGGFQWLEGKLSGGDGDSLYAGLPSEDLPQGEPGQFSDPPELYPESAPLRPSQSCKLGGFGYEWRLCGVGGGEGVPLVWQGEGSCSGTVTSRSTILSAEY